MPEHPAPFTPCRDAQDDEIPRSAKALAKAAVTTGWTVRTTYAHGTTIDAQGHPGRPVESVVVRLRRSPLAAVAAWHDGKFNTAYVWTTYTPARPIGSRELSRFVKEVSA